MDDAMKRFIFIIIMVVSVDFLMAQQKHVIQRGENAAIIAQKYGVPLSDLRAANPDETDYFTGMTITIPARKVVESTGSSGNSSYSHHKPKKKGGFWRGLGYFLGEAFFTMRQTGAQQRLLHYGTQQTAVPINGSLDYLLDPRYAMMQVQQKQYDEYLLFTGGGKTMSYEEYQRQKAIERAQWEETKRMLESMPDEPTPKINNYPSTTGSKDCGVCHGSGKCNTCNGNGHYTVIGIGSGTHLCPNCKNHDGKCSSCGGTGKM